MVTLPTIFIFNFYFSVEHLFLGSEFIAFFFYIEYYNSNKINKLRSQA